jgi:hypothetical protein
VLEPFPPLGRTLRVSGRAHATRRFSALAPEVRLRIHAPPPAPLDLRAQHANEEVHLAWTEPVLPPCALAEISTDVVVGECPRIVGYNVYRRTADGRRMERLDETAVTPVFRDTSATLDRGWCYSVATLLSIRPLVESSLSHEACVAASLTAASDISSSGESKATIDKQAFP